MSTEKEIMQQAMAIARTHRDPSKLVQHAQAIAEKRKGMPLSEEHKARLKEAQRLRREREAQATGRAVQTADKKPVGRPRKAQPAPVADAAQKRGRGRPKKQTSENTPLPMESA